MKLNILGSGTCVPYSKRGSAGYEISFGDSAVMLDCGSGSTWKLAQLGINYLEIDHIFLSHLHPDHTGDLVPFLFATKYAYGSPYGEKRVKPLSIWGGQGFKAFFESLEDAFNEWIVPDTLTVNEIDEGSFALEDFTVSCVRTPHHSSSLAYRIEAEGKSIVYSGDTDYSESLIKLAKGADLLIIECALADNNSKFVGHLRPKDVISIVNQANPKRTVVTHLYPICDDKRVIETIRKNVNSEVIEAQDLLEVEV